MKEVIIDHYTDVDKLCADMEKEGMKPVSLSNAGLPKGKLRVTFLDSQIITQSNGGSSNG